MVRLNNGGRFEKPIEFGDGMTDGVTPITTLEFTEDKEIIRGAGAA